MSDTTKEFDITTHGTAVTKWSTMKNFCEFDVIEPTGNSDCEACNASLLPVATCAKHRVTIATPQNKPLDTHIVLSKSKKNRNIFWVQTAGVKFEGKDGSTRLLTDFIVQGTFGASEAPLFGDKDKWNIVGKAKITKANAMFVALIHGILDPEFGVETLDFGDDTYATFDNSISSDGVIYFKDRYLRDTVLNIGSGAKSKKVKLIDDYLTNKRGFHPGTNRARKFTEIKDLYCQMSLSADLVSIGQAKYSFGDKKARNCNTVKIAFKVNWIKCVNTNVQTTIDENGDEIEVEVPILNLNVDSSAESTEEAPPEKSKKHAKLTKKSQSSITELFQDDSDEEKPKPSSKSTKKPTKKVKKPPTPPSSEDEDDEDDEEEEEEGDDFDEEEEEVYVTKSKSKVTKTRPVKKGKGSDDFFDTEDSVHTARPKAVSSKTRRSAK